jgi:hypothetical protein
MNKSLADVVELIVFVIFLAVGSSLGVCGLFNEYRRTVNYSLEVEDKNTALKQSTMPVSTEYDLLVTPSEIRIMAYIQDSGMPSPTALTIGEATIEMDTSIANNNQLYSTELGEYLSEGLRYLIRYDYKTNSYHCIPHNTAEITEYR